MCAAGTQHCPIDDIYAHGTSGVRTEKKKRKIYRLREMDGENEFAVGKRENWVVLSPSVFSLPFDPTHKR